LAKDLPYLTTYKNVGALFDRIEKAQIPDVFNLNFLTETIGLKGSGDRPLIALLKKLGFLDNAGKPTPDYSLLKNKGVAKGAIAKAIRKAYAPLYAADENAHELPNDELKGLIAQISGAEEAMNRLITGTFNSLVKAADFKHAEEIDAEDNESGSGKGMDGDGTKVSKEKEQPKKFSGFEGKFNPEFRFNIEIHLPSNGTEETYLAIFNALRKSLG
jgi:hypothetical protein